jgi:hypothetical protein
MAASAIPPNDWFDARQLEEVAAATHEPASVTAARREAFGSFLRLPVELNPLYRQYAYFTGVDLRGLEPSRSGSSVRAPPAHENTVVVLHDARGTHVQAPPQLLSRGLRAIPVPEVLQGADAPEFLRLGAAAHEKFAALNTALLNRGLLLEVPNDLELPVRVQDITVLSDPNEALFVRRSIRTGRATRVCYTEEVYSTSAQARQRLYSSVVHARTGPDSQLVYLTVHAPDPSAVSFYSREAETEQASRLAWVWAGFDGMRTNYRNESHLTERGSEIDDLQAVYGDGSAAYNNFVEVTHDQSDTRGQSITRGVYRDHARGTARGMMRIQAKTAKVVSYLSQHAMLLSKTARSEAAPDLEILSSNDVKATHSASVAPIDPERIFYLESRGIDSALATRMIAEGYLSAVFDRAPIEGLSDVLRPTLDTRWDGRSVVWTDEGPLPGLPPLRISGWGDLGDWRYDTKLRDSAGRA